MEKNGLEGILGANLSNILLKEESTLKLEEASQDLYEQTELAH